MWEDLSRRVASDLRGVVRYRALNYEARRRDDVEGLHSGADERNAVADAIITQLRYPSVENSYKAGKLLAQMRVFEEAWILARADDSAAKSGVIVSIQRNGETATCEDVVWCIRYLEETVAGRLSSEWRAPNDGDGATRCRGVAPTPRRRARAGSATCVRRSGRSTGSRPPGGCPRR